MIQIKSVEHWSRLFILFLKLLLLLPICAMSQQQTKDIARSRTFDSAQIIAIIHDWEISWNSHDMHAFANLFHEDGIWILWTGEVWKGKITIEEGHAKVHKTVFRNSVQKEEVEEISFVGPEAAVVRFYSTLTGDERYPEKVVRSRKILIITKRNNIWKVGWGQNTRFPDVTTK
jgi:uncharacterized protein (TIGR02246 family)